MPYKKVELAEECAVQAFGIDEDYYFKHRQTRRREISDIRCITYRIAREQGKCLLRIISNVMGVTHPSISSGVKRCKDLASVDVEYENIYKRAKDLFLKKLAEMADNN